MGNIGKSSGLQNNFGCSGFSDKSDSDNPESTVLQTLDRDVDGHEIRKKEKF